MANPFVNAAKAAMTGSEVMLNRSKKTTDEIIREYPAGVTVDEFDVIVKDGGSTYPVFHIKDTDFYFNGGSIVAKIVDNWLDMYNGDIKAASEALKANGGVTFRLEKGKTKTGRDCTKYFIVD